MKGFVIGIVVLVALVVGYFAIVLHWSYSTGERAGWVQKFSNKGWLCKTWEGEMAMVSMPGSTAEKFPFTVWDDAMAWARDRTPDLVALDDALNDLAKLDLRQCRIVEMRFFAGLSIEETSQVLSVSPATVKREWSSARAWAK